jgi:hypothetical protein
MSDQARQRSSYQRGRGGGPGRGGFYRGRGGYRQGPNSGSGNYSREHQDSHPQVSQPPSHRHVTLDMPRDAPVAAPPPKVQKQQEGAAVSDKRTVTVDTKDDSGHAVRIVFNAEQLEQMRQALN